MNVRYGYIVLLACFLSSFSYGLFYSLGVFFKPLQDEFGWSATLISSVQSIHLISFLPSSFFVGWSTDKIGPGWTLGWGGTCIGLGFVGCGLIADIWQFYFFYIVASLGAGIIWSLPVTTVQRWFIRGRGLTLGIVASGLGFGTLLYAPTINCLIGTFGWRTAYKVSGIGTWIVLMTAAVLIKKSPESIGGKAFGLESQGKVQNQSELGGRSKIWRDGEWSFREAVRTGTFWMVCSVYFLTVLPIHLVMVHIVPYGVNLGIDTTSAAGALGLVGGFSIGGRILISWLAEKLGWRTAIYLCVFTCAGMFFWLLGIRASWMLYLFAVVYGFFYGAKTPLIPGLIGYLFPGRHLGTIIGAIHGIAMIGGAFGPILGGVVYDVTKSYRAAFVIGAVCWVLSGALLFFVKIPGEDLERINMSKK